MVAAPVALGLTALGTGAGIAAQMSAANAQERVLLQNAEMARLAGKDALRRGSVAAGQALAMGSRAVGQARARASASGVDVYSGSVLDVLGTTRLMSKLDAETQQINAASEMWGRERQAQNFANESQLAKAKGIWGSAATLLGGVTEGGEIAYRAGLFNEKQKENFPKFG